EVDQGATRGCTGPFWVLLLRLSLGQLLSKLDQFEEVLLVVDDGLTALLDQGVQERRHRLVVLRIHRLLINDRLTDVVDDGLGSRFWILADALGEFLDGSDPMFNDEVDETLVKGRQIPRSIRLDVGIEKRTHAGL